MLNKLLAGTLAVLYGCALGVSIIAAVALVASAQDIGMTGVASGGKRQGPNCGHAYCGVGDFVSGALYFYSCGTAYNFAYATGSNASCNIRRSSDSHTCDILIATTGYAGNTANCSTGGDNGQSVASFCNATTCFVTEAYDQTGNANHVTQATTSKQPTLKLTGCGGSTLPCMTCNVTNLVVLASANFAATTTNPWTISFVHLQPSTARGGIAWANNRTSGGLNPYAGGSSTANEAVLHGNSSVQFQPAANDNIWHAIQGIWLTGTSGGIAFIDGATTNFFFTQAGDLATNGFNISLCLDTVDNFGAAANSVAEVEGWGSQLNSTQLSNVNGNQHFNWAF